MFLDSLTEDREMNRDMFSLWVNCAALSPYISVVDRKLVWPSIRTRTIIAPR